MSNSDYKKKCETCTELQAIKPASVEGVWYPNLEELYLLVKILPKFKDVGDLSLLSKMRCGISHQCCSSYLNRQSMHDFWLLYWMMETTNKCWYSGQEAWK